MSAKMEESKEEVGTKGPQSCFEMCRQMMGGGMPGCCGPEMKEMMSRFLGELKAKQRDQG